MEGQTGGRIEKQFHQLFPTSVFARFQPNAWMDKSAMRIWYKTVYKPNISGTTAESGLILDDYFCHKDSDLMEYMKQDNMIRVLILPHYSAVLKPCDVRIKKSLKD